MLVVLASIQRKTRQFKSLPEVGAFLEGMPMYKEDECLGHQGSNMIIDDFYILKKKDPKAIAEILRFANENGLKTDVSMLDINISAARISSDKDFDVVTGLIDRCAKPFFRVILRKQMNMYARLYDEKVIMDIVEVALCGVRSEGKEYFISIYMDKSFIDVLNERYDLERIQ